MTLEALEEEPTPLSGLWDLQPWAVDALCAQTDPEAFFPEKGGSTRGAKAVCMSCNVRSECLEWALDRDERFGIWGGLSERERRSLKKDRAAEQAPTVTELPTQPTHLTEVPAMPEPQQPSYVDQIIAVMVATEGHASADVRAARKVVANALVALNKAVQAAEQPPPAAVAPKQPSAGKGAASHAIRERIAGLGATSAEVRAFARSQGRDVPVRGQLPAWAVDLYEEHHQPQAS